MKLVREANESIAIKMLRSIRKNGSPEGLLAGRTGRVIVTADSPPWYLRLVGDTTVRHVRDRTLAFCGIKPVHTTRFGPVKNSTLEKREGWLAKSASLGETDAARLARERPTGSATEATSAERVGAR